ncbi:non-hydrolyzing UDP-N-acetylglucosamine 2-epimerase [Candidatus Cloacimonas acidaminovorans]|uniref:UDP-N-acetylglucosamine 2-epimerase n=1 Tax=Cloacimonas acidaminovorans (strain Evry) TaxID=459349 RepID=B0VGV0_CLOAI|nr:UDP-N-acetylglucosamine 2-epimerase (non-hydrolyzing) [Candidatus Cloacimonas acidaminovorans]CAO80559.1 UDP-N-acetylglucosamine 2-epimerase [Candidatus Cloacimonas acidaminovorans str. Evry]
MRLIHLIVGARPNFMKMAPLYRELSLSSNRYEPQIIHTGQHYDEQMSKLFFNDLAMPEPSAYLNVGSGTQGKQTARIIERYEDLILAGDKPDLVIVAGDVNSTIACALVAKKLQIPVAHLEAGLRSYDEQMPEEINRVLTDRISDILLTPSLDANENLIKEGINPEKIHFVGNIMIDSLIRHQKKAELSDIFDKLTMSQDESYALVTLHRPSNVDECDGLKMLLTSLIEIGKHIKIIFPMHPRTKKNIQNFGLSNYVNSSKNIIFTEPLGYFDFLKLEMNAKLILTDSGGVQEESTYFRVPCLTLRENTERPITISEGTNQLVDLNVTSIVNKSLEITEGKVKQGKIPKHWDGKTAERVVMVLDKWFEERDKATDSTESTEK